MPYPSRLVDSWELENRARTPDNCQCNTNTYACIHLFTHLACIHTDMCINTCIPHTQAHDTRTRMHMYVQAYRHMCRTLVPVEEPEEEKKEKEQQEKEDPKPKAKAKSKRKPVLASGSQPKKAKK